MRKQVTKMWKRQQTGKPQAAAGLGVGKYRPQKVGTAGREPTLVEEVSGGDTKETFRQLVA